MKSIMKNKISRIAAFILFGTTILYFMRYPFLYWVSGIETELYELITFVGIFLFLASVLTLIIYNEKAIYRNFILVSFMVLLADEIFFLSSRVLVVLPLTELEYDMSDEGRKIAVKNLVYSDWNIKDVGFTNTTLVKTEDIQEIYSSYSSYCFCVNLSENIYLVFWRHSNPIQ